MGRPVEIEKRRELARAAGEVLLARGIDTPMSEVARELGMKRPTLLYHFPDATAVAVSLLEELLEEQAEFVSARMAEHDHPIDQLYARVRAVHAFHEGREERILLLTQLIASSSRESAQQVIEVGNRAFEAQRRAITRRLREEIKRGTVREHDPTALVRLVRSVVDGGMIQRVMTGASHAPVHRFLWEHVLAPLKIEDGARGATP